MTQQLADATARVSELFQLGRKTITGLLRQVTGVPSAVVDAEAAYRAGNGVVTFARLQVEGIGNRLAWSGTARGAFDRANTKLIDRMVRLQTYLLEHERTMSRAVPALVTARKNIANLLARLDAEEQKMLPRCRNVAANQVPALEREAQDTVVKLVAAAKEETEKLRKVLAELADRLDKRAAQEAEEREKERCPFSKKYGGDMAAMLASKRHEDARTHVYPDGKGLPTIGVGFNLTLADSRAKLDRILTAYPGPQFTAEEIRNGTAFRQIYSGQKDLTRKQVEALMEDTIARSEQFIRRETKIANYDQLPAPVKAVLVDIVFQRPAFLSKDHPEFVGYINDGNYEAAAGVVQRWGEAVGKKAGQRGAAARSAEDARILSGWQTCQ